MSDRLGAAIGPGGIPTWWPREAPAPHMLAIPRYVSPAERAESHKAAMEAKKLVKEKHNDAG